MPAKQDNAEKEKQRQHQEMADARAAFEQYGSARFMRTFWRFIAMDHPDSICLKFLRARKWAPTAVRAGVALGSLSPSSPRACVSSFSAFSALADA